MPRPRKGAVVWEHARWGAGSLGMVAHGRSHESGVVPEANKRAARPKGLGKMCPAARQVPCLCYWVSRLSEFLYCDIAMLLRPTHSQF